MRDTRHETLDGLADIVSSRLWDGTPYEVLKDRPEIARALVILLRPLTPRETPSMTLKECAEFWELCNQ